jgi:hypothetical protein
VPTGASTHHFLAANDLCDVLTGLLLRAGAPPGLYLDHGAYTDRTRLTGDAAGHGLADLAGGVRGSAALRGLTPRSERPPQPWPCVAPLA